MSTPEERIERAALDDLREILGWQTSYWASRFELESPIERLFSMALGAVGFARRDSLEFHMEEHAEKAAQASLGISVFVVGSQVQVRRYRVDFVLSCYRVDWDSNLDDGRLVRSKIAIECDGREFHHGNADFAARDKARDRELAEVFDAVIRFTGSELHANAYACALQAMKVAEAKLR